MTVFTVNDSDYGRTMLPAFLYLYINWSEVKFKWLYFILTDPFKESEQVKLNYQWSE